MGKGKENARMPFSLFLLVEDGNSKLRGEWSHLSWPQWHNDGAAGKGSG